MDYCKTFEINGKARTIGVCLDHIYNAQKRYDLLLCSAFKDDYYPFPNTVIGGLFRHGISVEGLSIDPEVDGKAFGFWISKEVNSSYCKRVGCLEIVDYNSTKQKNVNGIFSFMENIISYDNNSLHIKSIATPILGIGDQQLSVEFAIPCLLRAIINCFNNNDELEEVAIFVIDENIFNLLKNQLESLLKESFDVFISYSSKQSKEAINISKRLREMEIKPWIDSSVIEGGESYLEKIPSGIQNSDVFLLLLTEDSVKSVWVKKELQTAINCKKCIIPYKMNIKELDSQFSFMLSDIQIVSDEKMSIDDMLAFVNKKLFEVRKEK